LGDYTILVDSVAPKVTLLSKSSTKLVLRLSDELTGISAYTTYVDGKWVPVVDCINNGDGTVTVQFDKICPVAFLVPGTTTNSSTVSPATSDVSGVILWGSVMFVSLAAAVAIVIFRRKVNG
jgi:hypothetical protein